MSLLIGIVVGLFVLTVLVALHELGHALAAKKNGVVVEEFGIGFPPAAWSFVTKTDKILSKGTKVSLNWLPLGGFVKLQGEHDSDSNKGDYGSVSFWAKTQILLAGVAVNWLVAAILLAIISAIGMPRMIPGQFYLKNDAKISGGLVVVNSVVSGSPAAESGIEAGDIIDKIAGVEIFEAEQVGEISKRHAGKKVDIQIIRKNQSITKAAQIREKNDDKKGYLGVASSRTGEIIKTSWSSPLVGVGLTLQFSEMTFKGVGDLFVNFFSGLFNKLNPNSVIQEKANNQLKEAGKNVAGPLAIIGVIFPQAAEAGMVMILLLAAIISLTLACMNVLPIPALDGGRWLSTFIFRKILKKPLSAEAEEKLNFAGFAFVMILSLLVIFLDISRFIR